MLGLKKLLATGYRKNCRGIKLVYDSSNKDANIEELDCDGDFRSEECVKLLDEADIVVSNPPFSCHSDDTEVMTSGGWKLFKDVDIEKDMILSLNPETNLVEWVHAVDKIVSPVNGHLLRFVGRSMDFKVTGNHRMLVHSRRSDGSVRFKGLVDADAVLPNDCLKLSGFSWRGTPSEFFELPSVEQNEHCSRNKILVPEKKIPMNAWLEFFGFWLADGYVRRGNNSQGNPRFVVGIKQNKSNGKYVEGLFEAIGFPCKVYQDGNKANYEVYSKQLWTYLEKFGKSHDKYVPRGFLDLSAEALSSLIKGYRAGDSSALSETTTQFTTVSKALAENIQEILLKTNGKVYQIREVHTKYRGEPYLYYKILQNGRTGYSRYGKPFAEDYSGNVYCLTLERNHVMLVRRGMKAGWCGNCFREYVAQLVGHGKKFLIIGNINATKFKDTFPLIKNNKVWLGFGTDSWYRVPDDFDDRSGVKIEDGKKYFKVKSRWFTNLDHKKCHEFLTLTEKYDPAKYPKYDNYDAINVDKVNDIPKDWDGVMGVPITFLDKYNPEQFEIVGELNNGSDKEFDYANPIIDGKKKYTRILIKRKPVGENAETPALARS